LNIDIGLTYAKTQDYAWASQHYQKSLEISQARTPNNSKLLFAIFQ